MEELASTARPSIRMGKMSVARGGDRLRALLGSCVGLTLFDRRNKAGGLAHIVLPRAPAETDSPGKYVDTAIPRLIEEMQSMVGGELRLSAKIAGGACMFSHATSASIGQQNIQACERLLRELGIPVVAKHCGGTQGRRMSLDTATGHVLIEIVGREATTL